MQQNQSLVRTQKAAPHSSTVEYSHTEQNLWSERYENEVKRQADETDG